MNLNELIGLEQTCDATFTAGAQGVVDMRITADRKVEFVSFESGTAQRALLDLDY